MLKNNAWQYLLKDAILEAESKRRISRLSTNNLLISAQSGLTASDMQSGHYPVDSSVRIAARCFWMGSWKVIDETLKKIIDRDRF